MRRLLPVLVGATVLGLALAGFSRPHVFNGAATVVPTTGLQVQYTGTGSGTAFGFPYYFISTGDLTVTVNGTLQVLGTNYTVTLPSSDGAGGVVTFISGAPANGALVVITRTVPLTQATQLRGQGAYSPSSIENGLDRLNFQIQQLNAALANIQTGDAGTSAPCWISASGRSGSCFQDVVLGEKLYGWSEGGVWTLSDTQPP